MIESDVKEYPVVRGKVRDTYDIGDGTMVIVTTDRLSAFDFVLPTPIPNRGKVLTRLTRFWAEKLKTCKNHYLAWKLVDMPKEFNTSDKKYSGRIMRVKKLDMIPYECVARGFIAGSGYEEYAAHGSLAKVTLPQGLPKAAPLVPPMFTPAIKNKEGHDENISFAEMTKKTDLANELKRLTLNIFAEAQEICFQAGLYVADTKFEFGMLDGEIVLGDEILTPDSSRFWPVETYCTGKYPPCLDKQIVRKYLSSCGWDMKSPPPILPVEIVEEVQRAYFHTLYLLTGEAVM